MHPNSSTFFELLWRLDDGRRSCRTKSQWSSVSRLIERDPSILFVSKIFGFRHVMKEILVCNLFHFETNFISIMFELGCTKFRIPQEAIVDPFEMLLDASFFKIMGWMVFFLLWSFTTSVAMRSSLLNYVLWNWEVQCIFDDASIGHKFFQEMPACAIDDTFTPVWQAFFALRLGVRL